MASMKKREPTEEEKRKIWDAAVIGDLNTIEGFVSNGVDVTGVVDLDQLTALHMAAYNGHYNVVAYLLSHGARVNDVNNDNTTALHMAASTGHYNVVAYLLSHGARVNDVDYLQWTPLHYAAFNGYAEIADVLVKNKASISMKDNENKTPLQLAVEMGESDVVYFFIKQQKMDITQFDDKMQQEIDELVKRAEEKQAKTTIVSGTNKPLSTYKSETVTQLQQLQLDHNTQLTATANKPYQRQRETVKQQADKQSNTDRIDKLEKTLFEIQMNNDSTQQQLSDVQKVNSHLQKQLSLTQQQLLDVQRTNSHLQNQLSINQQQLSDVQKVNSHLQKQLSLTQQQLLDVQKTNSQLQNQLSINQQQLSDVQKQFSSTQKQLSDVQSKNGHLQNQLSLTQQQLLGVQSMMTCSRLWVVSHDQFTIGREIGRGAWATVHETKFRGATIAAKCLHHLITSPRTRELFSREMEMALHCQHQNIVTFLGATLEGPPVMLMELMGTSLRSAYEQGNIKDHQVWGILHDIARALHFLHTRPDPVIHRDVSSANVLLKALYNGEWLAKLGDLGTAKIQQQAATAGPGAIAYGAPEAADFTKHSPKMDVYSYGVLMLEVLTKTHPFQMVDALKTQVQQQFPQYYQLVTTCISQQSRYRPTMYDVIEQLDRINTARP